MEDPIRPIQDDSGAVVKPIEEIEDFDTVSPTLKPEPEKSDSESSPSTSPLPQPAEPKPDARTDFVMTNSEQEAAPPSTTGTVQMIPIEQITTNPYQPRKHFDAVKLAELAESITFQGIIQPLVISRTSEGFEIIVGERRYRAALLAGLKTVPAIVRGEISDRAKLELALIENLQREDLNPIEEARAFSRLSEEFGLTQDEIAKKVGKSRPAVANILRLLNLPAQIQRALIEGRLAEGHARALLPLEDKQKQMEVFEWIIREGVTVRDVENRVRELKNLPLKPYIRATKARQPDPELKQLEDALREKLGTRVRLQKTGDSGKIMIEFYSNEELQEIINRLSHKVEQPQQVQ